MTLILDYFYRFTEGYSCVKRKLLIEGLIKIWSVAAAIECIVLRYNTMCLVRSKENPTNQGRDK